MAKCSICGGDGPMIVIHQSCLYDLLRVAGEQYPPLCNLCGSVELCEQEFEQDTPGHIDCKRNFRLDAAKAQALIEAVTAND